MPYIWLAAAVFLLAGGGFGGYRIASNACKAERLAQMEKAEAARRVDESFTQGVSAGYEQVAAELRRITGVKTREVIRETQRIEYQCPLLPAGERLRIDSIRAANAAAGQPHPTLPADPGKSGDEPGRVTTGVFGADGDVR